MRFASVSWRKDSGEKSVLGIVVRALSLVHAAGRRAAVILPAQAGRSRSAGGILMRDPRVGVSDRGSFCDKNSIP